MNQETTSMAHDAVVARILGLLEQYGWEQGARTLDEQLQQADDEAGRGAQEFFQGWLAAERGDQETALRLLRALEDRAPLAGWARAGQAFVALRTKDFRTAHRLLD